MGIFAILFASLFNALGGVGIYYANASDDHFSPLAGIVIRVLANFSCVMLPFVVGRSVPKLYSWRAEKDLWLWGLLGVLTLLTFYYSVIFLGPGLATILSAGSGLFISILAPALTQQKPVRQYMWAALGCLIGMLLLTHSFTHKSVAVGGFALAVLSGFLSALAYLMVARVRGRHGPETVMLHWTVTNLAILSVAFFVGNWIWPHTWPTWLALIATGIFMAWAQYLTAVAYQKGKASQIACLSFCGPLLSVCLDLYLFKVPITIIGLAGVAIVVVCGLILPMAVRH